MFCAIFCKQLILSILSTINSNDDDIVQFLQSTYLQCHARGLLPHSTWRISTLAIVPLQKIKNLRNSWQCIRHIILKLSIPTLYAIVCSWHLLMCYLKHVPYFDWKYRCPAWGVSSKLRNSLQHCINWPSSSPYSERNWSISK